MSLATISGFAEELLQSQLLDEAQREALPRIQAAAADSRALAQSLLRREWLTAFQINQIFQGRGAGLTLGPYVLIDRLGEGGMGQVFKARQKTLQRLVALKVLRRACLDNPKMVVRFLREIRAASQLCHPHIVRAYDAAQINGAYYFAMELIEGNDLSRLVKENGPLKVEQACEYIRQAALGLQHAHERGMVHRDVKPANLLVARCVTADRRRSSACIRRPDPSAKKSNASISRPPLEYPWGILKILDLGLALCTDPLTGRSATHLTQAGTVMGTPEFIAPEQARDSHQSDIRADLYSLGCTFYFLLAGQPPFPNGTLTEKLLQHQFDEPAPLSAVRRDQWSRRGSRILADVDEAMLHVPARIEEVVARLMAKQPGERFQTPQELAVELQKLSKQLADGSLPRAAADVESATIEIAALPPVVVLAGAGAGPTPEEGLTKIMSITDLPMQAPRPHRRFAKLPLLLALVGGGVLMFLAALLAFLISRSNPSAPM